MSESNNIKSDPSIIPSSVSDDVVNLFLTKHNKQLNPNTKVVEAIRKRLVVTKGYCPCVPEQSEDTICPCKKFRETGHCCCQLYV